MVKKKQHGSFAGPLEIPRARDVVGLEPETSSKVLPLQEALDRAILQLKQSANAADREKGASLSGTAELRLPEAHRAAAIGERQIAVGSQSRKFAPEQYRAALAEAQRDNPGGNYTSWSEAAGAKLHVSAKTIRNNVPNPSGHLESTE